VRLGSAVDPIGDARVKYEEQLKAMRADGDAANKKLQEIRTASESAWQSMQAGMDAAWASMKNRAPGRRVPCISPNCIKGTPR
jgi:hypothetical protein